jgi:hypothetical protein
VDPRAAEIFDAEWEALRGEQEPTPAPTPIVQKIQITPTVATTRIETSRPVETIPDSPLVRAAKNYSQASAFLEAAHEELLNAQRVFETATEAKQKAVEELKRVVQEAAWTFLDLFQATTRRQQQPQKLTLLGTQAVKLFPFQGRPSKYQMVGGYLAFQWTVAHLFLFM